MPFVVLFIILWLCSVASPRDIDGRWAQLPQGQRDWFRSQKVPAGPHAGQSCCNEADGVYAEEDMRDGKFWVRFDAHGTAVDWMEVSSDVVLSVPNLHGRAVVWYWWENGKARIRCFIPGAGI